MIRSAGVLVAALSISAPVLAQDVTAFESAFAEAEQVRAAQRAPVAEERAAYARALRAFLRLPTDSDAQRARRRAGARCAHLAGDLALALELWEEALQVHPDDPGAVDWWLRAVLELRGGEAALAAALARGGANEVGVRSFVVAARGLAGGALFEAAAARLRRGDTDAGLVPFEVAAADAGAPLDLANLALSLRFLGRLDEAVGLYDRALAAAPDDELLWNDYGLCLKAADRPGAALRAFRRSVELESSPGDGPGWTNLALLARRGHAGALPDLVEGLRTVLRPRPTQELCRYMLIDALSTRPVPPDRRAHDSGQASR